MQNLKQIQSFKGHKDKAWNVSWNPTGTALASCGGDKVINIWIKEGKEYECKYQLEGGHNRTVRRVSWSPCGKYIAAASFDGTTSLWQLDEDSKDFKFAASLEGHENEVKSVTWSASGLFISTCSRDKSVWIWDVDHEGDFECSGVLSNHNQDVKYVQWNPVEDILASASYDNTIKMYRYEDDDWECFDTLASHTSTVWCLTFNKDGDKLASCGDDKTVKIWQKYLPNNEQGVPVTNIQKWKCVCTIAGMHNRPIYSISWDHVSDCIATGCGDDIIRVFRQSTADHGEPGQVTYDLIATATSELLGNDVNCVEWQPGAGGDPNLRTLASCDDSGEVAIWSLDLELL